MVELTEEEKQLLAWEEELKKQGNSYPQYSTSSYYNNQKQNLVEFELDFKPILEDISRKLRGDVYVIDNNGNGKWMTNPDKTKTPLNEFGVNDLMTDLVLLINNNKVLSNYNVDEINDRVRLIKHELRVKIYNNYAIYGIDNEYKMNLYPMLVHLIGSAVEDAYRRALNGETHKRLSEQRIVTQNEQIPNIGGYGFPQQSSKKSILKPWTWGS